jgi:hypothetical protein
LNFFTLYFGGIWLYIPLGMTFEQKTYNALLRNDFFVALSCSASPWGRLLSFSLFSLFFSFLCTRWCMLRFYILQPFLGDLSLVELNEKKLQAMAPLKTFLPLLKGKGCHRKMKKDYIKLHIISLKLVRIPRSGYVVVVHILQSVRIGS